MITLKGICLSLLLSTTLLAGCSTSSSNKDALPKKEHTAGTFCYKGGQLNNYDCNSVTASAAVPMHTRSVDEVWMYNKLEEIRDWLDEQKQSEQQP